MTNGTVREANLSLVRRMRKTDKGLPKYQDALESDVFILTGAEDLVPVLADGRSQRYSTSRTLPDGSLPASSARY